MRKNTRKPSKKYVSKSDTKSKSDIKGKTLNKKKKALENIKNIKTKKTKSKTNSRGLRIDTLKTVLVTAIVVVLISFFITFVYAHYYVMGVKQIPYIIRVGSSLGLTADNQSIDFGVLPPGATSFKSVVITPKRDMIIKPSFKGESSEWLSYKIEGYETPFIKANQTVTITFYATPDKNAKQGYYTGVIELYMFRCLLC